MNYKSTLVLVLLVIGAAAYFWFVDRDKLSSYEKHLVKDRIFKDLDVDEINRIVVDTAMRENETGLVINTLHYQLEKVGDGWNLKTPVQARVETLKIRQLLDSLKKVEKSLVIDGQEYQALERDIVGLVKPDVVATFYTSSTSITVRIGNKNVVGWEAYLEVEGRKQAYLVPSRFKDSLQLTIDNSSSDIREKNIFYVRRYEIDQIVVQKPTENLVLKRGEELTWRLIQPVEDVANKKKIDKLIEALGTLRCNQFLAETNLISKPAFAISVFQGLAEQTLLLSSRRSWTNQYLEISDCYIGQRAGYNQCFIFDPKLIEPFLVPVNDLRNDKLVVVGELEDPAKMIQKTSAGQITITKKNNYWDLEDCTALFEDEIRLEDYIYNWLELPITGFADPATAQKYLAKPWIEFEYSFKGAAKSRTIKIAPAVAGIVYAERSPGVYVTLSADEVAQTLVTNICNFFSKEVVDIPYLFVNEVVVEKDALRRQYIHNTNGWVALGDGVIGPAKQDILALLKDILPVKTSEYIGKINADQLAQFGLQAPSCKYNFKTQNGGVIILEIGASNNKGFFAKLDSEPFVFILRPQTVNSLKRLFDITVTQ